MAALGAAVAVSGGFACLTGPHAVTVVWSFVPALVGSLFFDRSPASRRAACRVISGVVAGIALLFEPLGLLYLLPSAVLVAASVQHERPAVRNRN